MSAILRLPQDRIAAATSRELLRQRTMVDYLRARLIGGPAGRERFHAVFLDGHHATLGDAPMGDGAADTLSLRMRELFGRALLLDASGIIIAHNHPSGQCRPSRHDLVATQRLKFVASALDLELVDHLIITQESVYSMRAGGNL